MASPQIEDGYTPIANEILEALCWMNLSPYEWRVMLWILRKTYGWKKKNDWISLSQFSKRTGLDRRHAHRAIKTLLNKKMVVICRDDKKHPRYGFQKDYEKWKFALKGHVFKEKMHTLRERRERKSAYTDDKIVPLQAPTKETNTKEKLKEREERELFKTSFLSKKENPNLKVWYPDEALNAKEKAERYERREQAKQKAYEQLKELQSQGIK